MDFSLSDEQQMIIKTTKDFVANELYPHEKEVDETGVLQTFPMKAVVRALIR
jgi:acyl-CoA dehydrogenase